VVKTFPIARVTVSFPFHLARAVVYIDAMFKFIHAADIHLDSPLRGLARYEGAPVDALRGATRQALMNLVELALEEEVDFLLIAGDIYDGDWKDHNTGLFFAKQMARLREAEIPVYLIAGNHDAQSVMTKSLRLPDNVHAFPTTRPDTVHLEALGVAIHGQGFATKSVTKDLTVNYPDAVAGAWNIGLLHTSLTGYEGHDTYAPCTVEGLKHLGYDYWALGHIHQQECVHTPDPAIWYPGCIQGRHVRETDKKGCLLVTVFDGGAHEVDFRELDVLRWVVLEMDASACTSVEEVIEVFQDRLDAEIERNDDRLLAARVVFTGECPAHGALVANATQLATEVRNTANISGGDQVWIEKVKVRTRPPVAMPDGAFEDGPLAQLNQVVANLQSDPDVLKSVAEVLSPLQSKLPRELTGDDAVGVMDDPARLAGWLDEAESLVRATWLTLERGE